MDIESLFPQLKEAQAYSKHRNYTSALEVYTEILNDLEENTEEYSYILLEYSQCLIDCIMYQSELNYKRILQTKTPTEDQEIEEDLENAWECLETCRLYFEDLSNRNKLSEVHKSLGDVLCLQNYFEEGKVEYHKALDYCDDDNASIQILECIADCYRNMKMTKESIETYEQASELCVKLGLNEQAQEYNGLIEGIKILKMQDEDEQTDSVPSQDDTVPIDVNHLKKKVKE